MTTYCKTISDLTSHTNAHRFIGTCEKSHPAYLISKTNKVTEFTCQFPLHCDNTVFIQRYHIPPMQTLQLRERELREQQGYQEQSQIKSKKLMCCCIPFRRNRVANKNVDEHHETI